MKRIKTLTIGIILLSLILSLTSCAGNESKITIQYSYHETVTFDKEKADGRYLVFIFHHVITPERLDDEFFKCYGRHAKDGVSKREFEKELYPVEVGIVSKVFDELKAKKEYSEYGAIYKKKYIAYTGNLETMPNVNCELLIPAYVNDEEFLKLQEKLGAKCNAAASEFYHVERWENITYEVEDGQLRFENVYFYGFSEDSWLEKIVDNLIWSLNLT
ncbi:MAG: hypothetical protein J6L23_00440 [Clostridia bacterium]|nr:hypothetical protein [Clostridia bacterium]